MSKADKISTDHLLISYEIEKYQDIAEELTSIFSSHYEEVESLSDEIPLDVNHLAYFAIEDEGGLLLAVARHNGEIIGYILNFVSYSLHNMTTLMSANDALYVHPDYRGSGVFKELLAKMEDELKQMGVKYLTISIKTEFNIGKFLENKGFNEVERNYEKYLGV